ncbi:sigma-70 family RNA polymerase sigma factor [Brevibacillus massiliensis]|uniref:sigma-70 family RNA polymerase sigma factor n=1 Tax=Brevibacillus massiliensis TaxID=1118054 RepID=UPI0002E5C80F|nr:sigma-70 family RNA polymerase sigma factor [Brevibacillus massiliensis]
MNAKADEIKWALQPTKDAVFEGLMSEYGDKILQLVYLNVKDRTIAEDITQEVFISAYRHLETFRGESSYKTWLYRIAINETKKYLRSWSFRKIFSTIKTKDEKPVETADQINLETIVMTKQDKAEIAEIVMSMSPQYRQVITLFYYEDLTIKETAHALGVSEETVRTKLHRARKQFKKRAEKEGITWT